MKPNTQFNSMELKLYKIFAHSDKYYADWDDEVKQMLLQIEKLLKKMIYYISD